MTNFRRTIHNIFVWSYERGTIQYDIICALILAFVFLVPPSCFVSKRSRKTESILPEHYGLHSKHKTSERSMNKGHKVILYSSKPPAYQARPYSVALLSAVSALRTAGQRGCRTATGPEQNGRDGQDFPHLYAQNLLKKTIRRF